MRLASNMSLRISSEHRATGLSTMRFTNLRHPDVTTPVPFEPIDHLFSKQYALLLEALLIIIYPLRGYKKLAVKVNPKFKESYLSNLQRLNLN